MGMKKLALVAALVSFAFAPAMAGNGAANGAGETVITEAQITMTAACKYGYAKSKTTNFCEKLKCGKYKKLNKAGHKCIRKRRKGMMKSKPYRGSH